MYEITVTVEGGNNDENFAAYEFIRDTVRAYAHSLTAAADCRGDVPNVTISVVTDWKHRQSPEGVPI